MKIYLSGGGVLNGQSVWNDIMKIMMKMATDDGNDSFNNVCNTSVFDEYFTTCHQVTQ